MGENCGQMCSGEYCAVDCEGENCGQMCSAKGCGKKCSGKNCANNCKSDFCGCECVGENCGASCTGENCGPTKCCEGRKAATCADGTAPPTFGAWCVDDATDAADKCIECNEGFSLTIAGNGRRHRRQLLYYGGEASPPSLIIEIPMDVCNNVDLASLSATEVAALKANLLQAAAAAGGFDIDDVGVEGVQFVQNGVQVRLRSQRATSNANDPIIAVLPFTEGSGADADTAKGYADTFNIAVQSGSVSVSVTLDDGKTLSADVTKGTVATDVEVGADGGCPDSRASNYDPLATNPDTATCEWADATCTATASKTPAPTPAPTTSPTPSHCNDGIKNGDEVHEDCGGSC